MCAFLKIIQKGIMHRQGSCSLYRFGVTKTLFNIVDLISGVLLYTVTALFHAVLGGRKVKTLSLIPFKAAEAY